MKRDHEQVRNIEASAIFIPFDAVNDMEGGTIKVKVKLDNMIEKIEDNASGKICWKNTNGMPVDYDISSMKQGNYLMSLYPNTELLPGE